MNNKSRRMFLAHTGVAALFAFTGCIGNGGDEQKEAMYAVTEDGITDNRVVHHSAELTQHDLASSESPLQLRVSVTNEGDEPISFGERRKALFWAVASDGFMVIPNDDEFYEWDDDIGHWVLPDGFAMTEEYQVGELESDESMSQDLVVVVNDQDELDEIYPDEIGFETTYSEFSGDGPGSEDSREYSWGFVLEKEG